MSYSDKFDQIGDRLRDYAAKDVPSSLGWEALEMEELLRPKRERSLATWWRLGYHLAFLLLLLVRCGDSGWTDHDAEASLVMSTDLSAEGGGCPEELISYHQDEECGAVSLSERPLPGEQAPVRLAPAASDKVTPPIYAVSRLPVSEPDPLPYLPPWPVPAVVLALTGVEVQPLTDSVKFETLVPPATSWRWPTVEPASAALNEEGPGWWVATGLTTFRTSRPDPVEEATFRYRPGVSLGVGYTTKAKGGPALAFGVAYRNYRSTNRSERTWRANVYQPGTVDTVYLNPVTGETTESIIDSLPATYKYRFQQQNSYEVLGLTAGVTTRIGRGKVRLGLGAGLTADVALATRGRELVAPTLSAELPASADKFSLGGYGEVNVYYVLNGHTSIRLTGQARAHLLNMLEDRIDGNPLQTYGLSVGVHRSLR